MRDNAHSAARGISAAGISADVAVGPFTVVRIHTVARRLGATGRDLAGGEQLLGAGRAWQSGPLPLAPARATFFPPPRVPCRRFFYTAAGAPTPSELAALDLPMMMIPPRSPLLPLRARSSLARSLALAISSLLACVSRVCAAAAPSLLLMLCSPRAALLFTFALCVRTTRNYKGKHTF